MEGQKGRGCAADDDFQENSLSAVGGNAIWWEYSGKQAKTLGKYEEKRDDEAQIQRGKSLKLEMKPNNPNEQFCHGLYTVE